MNERNNGNAGINRCYFPTRLSIFTAWNKTSSSAINIVLVNDSESLMTSARETCATTAESPLLPCVAIYYELLALS